MGSKATTGTGTGLAEPAAADVRADASPAEAAEPTRGGSGRWWIVVALVVGFALQVAWRIWLIRSVSTPVAHADEDRYLLSARAIAGGPGGLGNDTAAFRRMGYPLMLSPVYAFVQDPFKVYHAAQIIGAVFNSLAFPLAYLFGRRVFGVTPRLAVPLAFVAAALPALAYYSQFTLTDVMFAPLGLAWLLLIHTWIAATTGRVRAAAAIGAGVVVGYAYVVHVRGLVMLGIYVLLLAALTYVERSRWKLAAASVLTALVVTRVDWLTQRAVNDELVTGGVEPGGRLVERLTEAGALVQLLCDAVGQIWYTGVGTWGLGAVGLVVAAHRVLDRDRAPVDWPQRVTLAVALATMAAIAFMSAAALPEDMRVSNHAYYRYVAFLAPVWVMLAGVALIGIGRSAAVRLFGWAAGLVLATGFLVLTQMRSGEWFHPFDTPEVSFLTYTWDTLPVAQASVEALALLGLLGYLLAMSRPGLTRGTAVALAGILALNVLSMEVVNAEAVRPMVREQYGTAPRLVHDIKLTDDDVVATSRHIALGVRLNHQREVYWRSIRIFDHRAGDRPPSDATAVVGPWRSRNKDDWDGTSTGWRRAAGDPVQEWSVWLREDDPRFGDGSISRGNGS